MAPRLNFSTVDRVMQICSENGLRAHPCMAQSDFWFFKVDSMVVQVMLVLSNDAREEFYKI